MQYRMSHICLLILLYFYKSMYVWNIQIKCISYSPGDFVGNIMIDGQGIILLCLLANVKWAIMWQFNWISSISGSGFLWCD